MTKYLFRLCAPNGEQFEAKVECDELDFDNSWWCRAYRYRQLTPTEGEEHRRQLIYAVPSEHLLWLEIVE